MFLSKYDSLDSYDEYVKKKITVDNEEFQIDKNIGWNLITDKPDGLMFDHEHLCIDEVLFDRIQSTHQESNISLKTISNGPN